MHLPWRVGFWPCAAASPLCRRLPLSIPFAPFAFALPVCLAFAFAPLGYNLQMRLPARAHVCEVALFPTLVALLEELRAVALLVVARTTAVASWTIQLVSTLSALGARSLCHNPCSRRLLGPYL